MYCKINYIYNKYSNMSELNTRFKVATFWDITPCSLVEVDRVSEVRTASIIREMKYSVLPKMSTDGIDSCVSKV
jgi:hypothetical protein